MLPMQDQGRCSTCTRPLSLPGRAPCAFRRIAAHAGPCPAKLRACNVSRKGLCAHKRKRGRKRRVRRATLPSRRVGAPLAAWAAFGHATYSHIGIAAQKASGRSRRRLVAARWPVLGEVAQPRVCCNSFAHSVQWDDCAVQPGPCDPLPPPIRQRCDRVPAG